MEEEKKETTPQVTPQVTPHVAQEEAEKKALRKFAEAFEKAPYAAGIMIATSPQDPTHMTLCMLGVGGVPIIKLSMPLEQMNQFGQHLSNVYNQCLEKVGEASRIILPH
jgi:hypothetical protein